MTNRLQTTVTNKMKECIITSDILAIMSTIIAVIAIFVAVWQARISHKILLDTRAHNKRTVHPWLKLITDYDLERIEIKNCGLGPAMINEINYFKKSFNI